MADTSSVAIGGYNIYNNTDDVKLEDLPFVDDETIEQETEGVNNNPPPAPPPVLAAKADGKVEGKRTSAKLIILKDNIDRVKRFFFIGRDIVEAKKLIEFFSFVLDFDQTSASFAEDLLVEKDEELKKLLKAANYSNLFKKTRECDKQLFISLLSSLEERVDKMFGDESF